MGWILLVMGLAAFALATTLTPLAMWVAVRTGVVDLPGGRKQHRREVPYGGGLSLYLAVWITVLAGLFAAWRYYQSPPVWLPDSVAVHLAGVHAKAPQLLVILAGATIVMLLGLVDDKLGLPARLKLAVQVMVAVLLVLAGVRATIFIKFRLLTDLITVIWIVGLINAFNFLDNMDALSAGCGLVIAALFLVVSIQTGQYFVGAMLVVLAGALAGFLLYNRPPARVFLGDAGSYLLGYMLAVLSVVFTFTEAPRPLIPIALPLLIFAIPIYDSASVVLIRLRERRNPFEADRRHFSHRLVALGMSEREAVFTIHLLTLALGLSATLLHVFQNSMPVTGPLLVLAQVLAILGVIVMLERSGARRKP